MAANVETMFYTREKPWHGLGVQVQEAPLAKDALAMVGLDWRVEQEPIYTEQKDLKTVEGNQLIDKAYQLLCAA